jgi:hypothetical protein
MTTSPRPSATVPVEKPQENLSTVLGASKSEVDQRLQAWSVREDKLSTATTHVFRYTQDVTMVIAFRGGKAIGVAVIDRPDAGVQGISEARFQELVQIIGRAPATASDVKRDEFGIREFYVGETEGW